MNHFNFLMTYRTDPRDVTTEAHVRVDIPQEDFTGDPNRLWELFIKPGIMAMRAKLAAELSGAKR